MQASDAKEWSENKSDVSYTNILVIFYIGNVIGIITMGFAYKGMEGINKQQIKSLKIYCYFKHVQIFALVIWNFVEFLVLKEVNKLLEIVIGFMWNLYWTYVVWSAYKNM